MGFNGFKRVYILSFTGGLLGLIRLLNGFDCFFWVSLGFGELLWVLVGFNRLS